jgi:hypothetical protein
MGSTIRSNINQNIALMTPEQRDQLPLALIEELKAIAADARVIESEAVEVRSQAAAEEEKTEHPSRAGPPA